MAGRNGRTAAEKQLAREQHERMIVAALEDLGTSAGMAAYLVAGELHEGNMSPGNLALVAYQAPGQLVGRYGFWKYDQGVIIRKGMTADVRLTGGKGLPVANWSASRVGYEHWVPSNPDREYCEGLAASWKAWPDRSLTGVRAWHEDVRPALVTDRSGREYTIGSWRETISDEIPW